MDSYLEPEFCLHAQPLVMEDGSVWLSVAHGVLKRRGGAEAQSAADAAPAEGATCVSCGPGLGDVVLQPEIRVTVLVPKGQSLLVSGLGWRVDEEQPLTPRGGEYVVLTPTLEAPE